MEVKVDLTWWEQVESIKMMNSQFRVVIIIAKRCFEPESSPSLDLSKELTHIRIIEATKRRNAHIIFISS